MTTWKIEDRDDGRKIVPEIPLLSGPDLIRLMRRNRVTMPQLAKRLSMSQDRIRQRKFTAAQPGEKEEPPQGPASHH